MRIRTADNPHSEDAIEAVAEFYDCNKTKAIVSACGDVPALVDVVKDPSGDNSSD